MLASLRRGGLRIYLIAREERVNTSGQPITITNEADRLARPYKTHDYIYIYICITLFSAMNGLSRWEEQH